MRKGSKLSDEHRAKLSVAQKKRWAKVVKKEKRWFEFWK